MKARTNQEKIAQRLSNEISAHAPAWLCGRLQNDAISPCKLAVKVGKDKAIHYCSHCGGRVEEADKHCPHCGRAFGTIEHRRGKNTRYYRVVQRREGHHVARYFAIQFKIAVRKPIEFCNPTEVFQIWDIEGQEICVSKRIGCQLGACYGNFDLWSWESRMSIRNIEADQIQYAMYYAEELSAHMRYDDMNFAPHYETIYKQDKALARSLYQLGAAGRAIIEKYWHAIKIAMRHGYKIADVRLWADNLDLYEKLGMDTHCPKHIMQVNLESLYEQLNSRYDRAVLRKTMKADDEKYKRELRGFLGICFVDDKLGIHCHVLRDVYEFKQEGDYMQHCVFKNGYYKRFNSLILSVRDLQGNRLATIEFDFKNKRVLQCRGKGNTDPERKKDILKVMKDNYYRFSA